jgi:hypothetical protein
MPKLKKPRKPTSYQSSILARIARSRLIKTRLPSKDVPVWIIDGSGEISHECAQALIRNGWVKPQRDGLSMFEESQSYLALVPRQQI